MSIRRFTNRMSSIVHPHHSANPNAGLTPASEKSIYLDPQSGPTTPTVDHDQPLTEAQADVYRQPSVAVGRAPSPSEGPGEQPAMKLNGIPGADKTLGSDHPSPPYERRNPMPGALISTPDIYTADKNIDFAKKAPVQNEPTLEGKPKPEPMVARAPVEEKAVISPSPETYQKFDGPALNENATTPSAMSIPQESVTTNATTSAVEEPLPASVAASNDATILPSNSKERAINGAFSHGPGLTGPAATVEPDQGQHRRMTSAESMLDAKTKSKLAKDDEKISKRMSKMIKSEGKSQRKNLDIAISELAKIEKIQKQASADESRALTKHAKAIKAEHKLNMNFLSTKAKHESAVADLKSRVERLEACKEHARLQTELLQQKTREVEELRQQKAVDERERELKLRELATKPLTT